MPIASGECYTDYREGKIGCFLTTGGNLMNALENIHLVLGTACEKHEIGMAELCRYHQRLRDILAQYEGGRLPDAAYRKAETLNKEIKQRFSPMMEAERERAMPGLSLIDEPEQPWQQQEPSKKN
jgi:hypothetical protein